MMKTTAAGAVTLFILLSLTTETTSFVTSSLGGNGARSCWSPTQVFMAGKEGEPKKSGFFGAVDNFFEELDAFIDDATNRRLGGGAAFYGKRKSGFYGEDDSGRKVNKGVADPLEDYQGPAKSGYFQWMQDEDGNMVPVTRMKKKNIERNPKFWDRNFDEAE
jgi:hypothetical protein